MSRRVNAVSPRKKLQSLSLHWIPPLAQHVLFTPLDKLVKEMDKVYSIPITSEDFSTFHWCSWPNKDWQWKRKDKILRICVIRMFWLQCFVAKAPTSAQYWCALEFLLMLRWFSLWRAGAIFTWISTFLW